MRGICFWSGQFFGISMHLNILVKENNVSRTVFNVFVSPCLLRLPSFKEAMLQVTWPSSITVLTKLESELKSPQ